MLHVPAISVWVFLMTAGMGVSIPAAVASGESTATYYVSAEGSDINAGRSPDLAWRSITRLESVALQPGDRVLLRRGDTWREQLTVSSSGTAEAPVRFGAYGEGPLPRIAGTAVIAPDRNAIRNFDFAEFRGALDDGAGDEFLHFTASGGRVEAVSDTPAGDGVAVKLTKDGGSKAHLFAQVYLPAETRVTLHWKARSSVADGAVALRHRLDGSARFLQTDLESWSTAPCWRAFDLAGGVGGPWQDHSLSLNTDAHSGMYQLYFISGNAGDGSATWLDDVQLRVDWMHHQDHIYRIGTGYLPRRLLIKGDDGWTAAVYRAAAPTESLGPGQWSYAADDGHLYLHWTEGNPATAGVEMEISVPESGEQGQCGIYIDRPHVAVDSLAVEGWPDDAPAFNYVGGIAITDAAHSVSISRCRVDFNYRVGAYARADHGRFTDNRFSYNGGSGLVFYGEARSNFIARNESSYNGFQGVDSDDGEGIGLGRGTADNVIEANSIHHNNLNLDSGNHGGLVLYQSSRNIVRYNRIFANTKSGLVIEGDENQIYYNLIYANGTAAADTTVSFTANFYLRDGSADGPGGNRVFNNVCYGGSADVRWMGNLFIKEALKQAEIRNNVFWGFENLHYNDVQLRIGTGTNLNGSVFSNNLIGPESPGFVHYLGQDYTTLENYRNTEGQDFDSISRPPQFTAPEQEDFRLRASSPLIDAGMDVGLQKDFDGNRLSGRPDIGALEFLPSKQQALRMEYHRWLSRCYGSKLSCGDVDADGIIHPRDRRRQYRTILRGLWNWLYSCWLPAMT